MTRLEQTRLDARAAVNRVFEQAPDIAPALNSGGGGLPYHSKGAGQPLLCLDSYPFIRQGPFSFRGENVNFRCRYSLKQEIEENIGEEKNILINKIKTTRNIH